MSKKKKTEYKKHTSRKTWGFNPKTRVKPAKQTYNRLKEKLELKKEIQNGFEQ